MVPKATFVNARACRNGNGANACTNESVSDNPNDPVQSQIIEGQLSAVLSPVK